MSEAEDTPAQVDIVDVDVRQWVAAAKSNPVLYRARCVTEIVLTSIGIAPDLKKALVLKRRDLDGPGVQERPHHWRC